MIKVDRVAESGSVPPPMDWSALTRNVSPDFCDAIVGLRDDLDRRRAIMGRLNALREHKDWLSHSYTGYGWANCVRFADKLRADLGLPENDRSVMRVLTATDEVWNGTQGDNPKEGFRTALHRILTDPQSYVDAMEAAAAAEAAAKAAAAAAIVALAEAAAAEAAMSA